MAELAVVNRLDNPNAVFGDKLSQVNTSNHYTAQPLTVERIKSLDRATAPGAPRSSRSPARGVGSAAAR